MGTFIENNPSFILLCVSALLGLGIWLGTMQTNINTLKGFMKEIRDDIKEIRKSLKILQRL